MSNPAESLATKPVFLPYDLVDVEIGDLDSISEMIKSGPAQFLQEFNGLIGREADAMLRRYTHVPEFEKTYGISKLKLYSKLLNTLLIEKMSVPRFEWVEIRDEMTEIERENAEEQNRQADIQRQNRETNIPVGISIVSGKLHEMVTRMSDYFPNHLYAAMMTFKGLPKRKEVAVENMRLRKIYDAVIEVQQSLVVMNNFKKK